MKEPCKTQHVLQTLRIFGKGSPKVIGLSSRELGLKSVLLTPTPASGTFFSFSAITNFSLSFLNLNFIFYIYTLLYLFVCLFLAALGLHCCMQAFSSCGAQVSHCSGFSCFGAQALGYVGFSSCGTGAH